jgi:hypothetical protein
MRRAYERRLIEIIEDGMAKGAFATTDARVAAFAILALLTGVCTWYRPTGRLGRDEIVAVHTRLVLNGLRGGTATKPGASQKKVNHQGTKTPRRTPRKT